MFGWNKQRNELITPTNVGGTNTVVEGDLDRYFDVIHTLLLVLDVDGRVIKINQFGLDLLGYTREEIIGKVWWEICVPERCKNEVMSVFNAAEGDAIAFESHENPVLTRSGEEREIRWHNAVLKDSEGKIIGQIATGEDISESKKQNQKLKESEERIRIVFEHSPEGLYIRRLDGVFVEANKALLAMIGYTREEVLGKKLTDLRVEKEEDIKRVGEIFLTLKQDELSDPIQVEITQKSGAVITVEVQISPMMVGNETMMFGITKNLTMEKQKENQVRENNSFLEQVIDNIPAMIFVKDAKELRFIRFNKAGADLIGVSPQDMIGKNDYDFFPQGEAEAFIAHDKQVLLGGKLLDVPEEEIKTKNRGIRLLHTKKIPIIDEAGKPLYLLGISEDITERKKFELELKQFKQGIERSNDVVFVTDKNGLFTYTNFAFEEVYGYKLEEIKANTPRILKSGKHPSEFYQKFWETLNRGSVVSTKLINKKRDGGLITMTITASPIINEAKQVVGFLAIQRDVTKEEEAEAALSARAEELERMNKVMIGREMRMVELKNEIKRLTGEEPKAGGEE